MCVHLSCDASREVPADHPLSRFVRVRPTTELEVVGHMFSGQWLPPGRFYNRGLLIDIRPLAIEDLPDPRRLEIQSLEPTLID